MKQTSRPDKGQPCAQACGSVDLVVVDSSAELLAGHLIDGMSRRRWSPFGPPVC